MPAFANPWSPFSSRQLVGTVEMRQTTAAAGGAAASVVITGAVVVVVVAGACGSFVA